MSKLDRRSVIVSGSALLTTGVIATVGAGSTEDDGNESGTDVDDETEIDADTGHAFDAEPTGREIGRRRCLGRHPTISGADARAGVGLPGEPRWRASR
ncbi:hypothetical protein ACLI4Q_07755 [Natrialbaceae archaeon A-CW1-1]